MTAFDQAFVLIRRIRDKLCEQPEEILVATALLLSGILAVFLLSNRGFGIKVEFFVSQVKLSLLGVLQFELVRLCKYLLAQHASFVSGLLVRMRWPLRLWFLPRGMHASKERLGLLTMLVYTPLTSGTVYVSSISFFFLISL